MKWSEEDLNKLETFIFGDSPELADELLALVIHGTKRATCGALHHYGLEGAPPLPQAGRFGRLGTSLSLLVTAAMIRKWN